MPINYARRLIGRDRTAPANRQLGIVLAFVAGAVNAGGFLAVHQYTSHMTGIVSAIADHLAVGRYDIIASGLGALLSFVAGAASCALMVNYSRRRRMHSVYALPLLVEATLLLGFGLLGSQLAAMDGVFVPITVMLLCFIMGLQNAIVTKLSNAEIRTTHITGIVTDIGIELGRLLYWNRTERPGQLPVAADRERLTLLSLLALSFFVGGATGAFSFHRFGYIATLPLAIALIALAMAPILDDMKVFAGARKNSRRSP
ncbi:YoaK family protein [Massilia sp. R2A-15]|uniref:YoaK family protein n=1 Tax=Massilia sp. R2A-15 TaxID=3064278 RepID=UPI002734301D|nr:YoaK family protein [Massilia sp. R2A-15]WLI90776.1 YoaK family protein [Massilia sp. R2A-15]